MNWVKWVVFFLVSVGFSFLFGYATVVTIMTTPALWGLKLAICTVLGFCWTVLVFKTLWGKH